MTASARPFRAAIVFGVIVFGVAALFCSTARAQEASTLTLADVVAASAAHYPQILQSLAAARAADARILSAEGAFDTVFSADARSRVTGFWDGSYVSTEVKRNLRPLGASVYGGYRVSDGAFPIYENIQNTNLGGEFKLGGFFSLLRDRSIDDRRFGVLDASLAAAAADFDVLLTQIGVQHQAIHAYWRWVAAGRQLEVYEDLLRIAEARESGLEQQVRRGARAAIFLTENKQNILRRQRLVTEATAGFRAAANSLSLYYRDATGAPSRPPREALPPAGGDRPLADEATPGMDADGEPTVFVSAALARRPELAILRNGLERAEARIALERNAVRPRLDVRAEVSRDLGGVGEGGPSFDSTDTIVGLQFSVPLQRREARGALRAARAEREALQERRRLAADRIEVDLRNILVDFGVAEQLVALAAQEVEQSLTMERAERRRFSSGASDFFLVNIREETTADARIRYFLADLQTRLAAADFSAATVNVDALGIEGASPDF